jgi:hypothetical protein
MMDLSLRHQYPPEGTIEATHLQKLMDMDVAFQLKLKELKQKLPHVLHSRVKNGSGLQLSKLLRSFLLEYADRYLKHGPGAFPTSFNVVEAFLRFEPQYMIFDLREEIEHLVSVDEYFTWYEKNTLPKKPQILKEIMTEGVVYSYEMISEANSLRISGDSQQVFAGVSFVRHHNELSCLLLAGENPPLQSDEDVLKMFSLPSTPAKKGITPHPDLTTKDRYLDGYPSFAKVILLARFDLEASKHDVRYVNLDTGPSYSVFTDDPSVFDGMSQGAIAQAQKTALDGLERYENLFAALTSMIYLPVFLVANTPRVQELEVATELQAMSDNPDVRETISKLGGTCCITHRKIRCLHSGSKTSDSHQKKIVPPQMEFKTDGYWKVIGPQEIGEDKGGKQVFGRTWVSRHELWSARSPQSFMLQQHVVEPDGPDPGEIYIQRSPAHEINLYKIGLTRRNTQLRSAELTSATGVPLPFGILATWKVGNCERVEQETHKRLAAYRVNPRREFFHTELSEIVRIVEAVIKELS